MVRFVNGNRLLDIGVPPSFGFLNVELDILWAKGGDVLGLWAYWRSVNESGPGPVPMGNFGGGRGAELWKRKKPQRGMAGKAELVVYDWLL